MAYVWQRWIADEFRAAGLTVIEVEGWENRGRPASTGAYEPDEGVTNHHTGTTSSAGAPGPTLKTLIEGRPDLPGPLAPWSVRFDGVVVVIAAGRCNHAGRIGKGGVPGAAIGADGNALFMGDEVDTNGTQTMPAAQRHSIAVTNAVYLKHKDRGVDRVHRHADISGTGKWDLGSLTTAQLRSDAGAALTELEDGMPLSDADKEFIRDAVRIEATAAVKRVLDAKQSNGRTLRANIRAGGNTKKLVRQVLEELRAEDGTP